MPQISPRRSVTALALAAAAVGSLLVMAPAAHAGDYLGACFDSVGHRTSPNGWNIPARNFSQGSSGVCVKELQFDISSTIGIDPEDWDGFVDGRFGPKTEKYVRRFQQASGLQADGIVGPRTWESLVSRTRD
ncbi:peptidoglycan-binding domain-containing protein [Streptomyces venezuelae]|uniref:peptidoglycan-binding domain-containing protein n=1 Tax=Streptomyces venezuelae TaxID=54571 RepID=UPI00332BC368